MVNTARLMDQREYLNRTLRLRPFVKVSTIRFAINKKVLLDDTCLKNLMGVILKNAKFFIDLHLRNNDSLVKT